MNVWNPSSVELLKQLWGTGMRAILIAQKLGPGFNKNMVIGKARRLNLALLKQPPAPQRKIGNIASVKPPRPMQAKLREVAIMVPHQEPSLDQKDWIPFMEAGIRTCRAVMGQSPENGLAMFCPNKKEELASYCPHHQEVFYDRSRMRR